MHGRTHTRLSFRLDSIEQFEHMTRTGRIKVDKIIPSSSGTSVLVRGQMIKVDGSMGLLEREDYVDFEDLPPTIQASLWKALVNLATGTVEVNNA